MDNLKNELSHRKYIEQYLRSKGIDTKKLFNCLNPAHNDKTPSMGLIRDGNRVNCFSCGATYDLFDLIGMDYGIDNFNDKVQKAAEIFNLNPNAYNRPNKAIKSDYATTVREIAKMPVKEQIEATQVKPKANFTEYYEKCYQNNRKAVDYLQGRGLSQNIIEKYHCGYDTNKNIVIMPVTESFYITRDIRPECPHEYRFINNPKKKDGAVTAILNEEELYRESDIPVFIVESYIDAISIEDVGGNAIAVNSTSNVGLLLNALKRKETNRPLILCLDGDKAGKQATERLEEGLRQQGVTYFVSRAINGEYEDPNAALQANREEFIRRVLRVLESTYRQAKKPDNITDYISNIMQSEIKTFMKDGRRKTGFSQLDFESGGLYSGLYLIGAISSLGKTTFVHQICDQMAEKGENILFFSLEQSRLELATKSIARQAALNGIKSGKTLNEAVSSIEIRNGDFNEEVLQATKDYVKRVGDKVNVIEGNFNCTVEYIRNYTRKYIQKNDVRPVIVIDYLQVLNATEDASGRLVTDKRLAVDNNVTELKRISRDFHLPIIVISSLNRSNYLTPVDFESFKESGGIEYTADVVMGLQLNVMNEDLFNSDTKKKEKRDAVKEAKSAIPRNIQLVCLKNRYGRSNFEVNFDYYPHCDLFQEHQDTDNPFI